MDIQSVIVSFEELNKTKKAIADALRVKGVTSEGRFSRFASEIASIEASPNGKKYQALLDNLGSRNVFSKSTNGEIAGVGKIDEVFEVITDNSVIIYSLYDITNVKIADGPYKTRVKQTPDNVNRPIDIDYQTRGNVNFHKLTLNVAPQEADNPNGSVNITYTVNGVEHTVTMPIKDIAKAVTPANQNAIYFVSNFVYNPVSDRMDLKQNTNVGEFEEDFTSLPGGSVFLKYKERPPIFNKLTEYQVGTGANAILVLRDAGNSNDNGEYIPVKVLNSTKRKTVDIGEGYNAAVIEIDNNSLVFHYSDNAGVLDKKCVIASSDYLFNTDTSILNKAKALKAKTYYPNIGIAMKADGSTITVEEAKAAGLR